MPASSTTAVADNGQGDPWTWPDEVLELAREKNVMDYLDPLLEMTRRIVPNRRWLHVYVSHDPEIADWKTVVFHIGVNPLSLDESREFQQQWDREWLRICPYPREPIFDFLLDTRDAWTGPLFSK